MRYAKGSKPSAADPSELRKVHAAAAEAELREWAQWRVGRRYCACCERPVVLIGTPCRKSFAEHLQLLRRARDHDLALSSMIDEYCEEVVLDVATSTDNMTEQ